MRRLPIGSVKCAAFAVLVLFLGGGAVAAEQAAADLLPASTVFYAEVQKPKELIGLVLDHPLFKRLEQSPEYQKALDNPKTKELKAVAAVLETRTGQNWRQALENFTGGGLAIAFDGQSQGVVVLARSQDRKKADAVRDALLQMVREDAKGKGNSDPINTEKYRGLTAYRAGEALFGNIENWTLVSNKEDLAKAVADAFLDGATAGKSLAGDDDFKLALSGRKSGGANPTAWAFVRLGPIRDQAGSDNPVFSKSAKSEDAGAELILGGLLGPLRNAPYATASLTLDKQHAKLAVSSPNDPSWSIDRKFFFAPGNQGGGAARPLKPQRTILSASVYRDLAGWWAAGPDLLNEGAAAKMAQADSGLSTFLGGKSFGTDLLGALKPQIQFVVAAQDYKAAEVPEPTIKLPAFATVLRLKEKQAEKAQLRKHFRVAFQSIVALANLDGSAKGRPMLAMNTEKRGGADILSASFDTEMMDAPAAKPDADADADKDDPNADKKDMKSNAVANIHFNFSPALVISRDHLIFCSTKQIAQELADLAAKEGSIDTAPKLKENTLLEINPAPGAELLRANRDQLVTQNILEKGHSRAAAEKEVDLLVKLVESVKDAKLRLTPTDKSITIEAEVTTDVRE